MTLYNMFSLIGGLGLVLYGMKLMSDGLQKAAGEKLRKLMGVLTTNRFLGLLVGIVVAAILQSSGATIMVVGFVNAGLMSLSQAVGVIMGTNIGTTLFAQMMSLDISSFAPLFIMMGVLPMMFSKQGKRQMLGQIFAGFGILFLGMDLMKVALYPLRDSPVFRDFMLTFSNPLLGVLIGTAITAVIQSSAASVAILQSLAAQGLITLNSAVFLVLGFNIGTTSSAAIGCIGAGRNGKRAAIMHTAIKALGAMLFILFLRFVPLIQWIQGLSPGNVVWQIANVHMAFNLINTVFLFPFAHAFVRFATKLLPVVQSEKLPEEASLRFVNDSMLNTPGIAVANIVKETARMGEIACHIFEAAKRAILERSDKEFDIVARDEYTLNTLNREITVYLVKLSRDELTDRDSAIVGNLYHMVSDLERVGDHAENIANYAKEMQAGNYVFSQVAQKEMAELVFAANEVLRSSVEGMRTEDISLCMYARRIEQTVDEMAKRFRQSHIDRMRKEICDPVAGTIFTDMIINLERLADHADNIAQRVIEQVQGKSMYFKEETL